MLFGGFNYSEVSSQTDVADSNLLSAGRFDAVRELRGVLALLARTLTGTAGENRKPFAVPSATDGPQSEAHFGAVSRIADLKNSEHCEAMNEFPEPPPVPQEDVCRLLHLPRDMLQKIVVTTWKHWSPGCCTRNPAYALYQTCSTARDAMLPWIGRGLIRLNGAEANGAQETLQGFPRMAMLRTLELLFNAADMALITRFRSSEEAKRLATVQHVRFGCSHANDTASFTALASELTSLQTLKYDSLTTPFTSAQVLHQLGCLQRLHIKCDSMDLSTIDARALGSLPLLQRLKLPANNLEDVLPQLCSLARLTALSLVSDTAVLTDDLPIFSCLSALPHLRKLKWTPDNDGPSLVISPSTLSAICSCSHVVHLAIPYHVVFGASQIKLLLEMPNLEFLAVAELQPDTRFAVTRCCLKTVKICRCGDNFEFLARLPKAFHHLDHLHLRCADDGGGGLHWRLGVFGVGDSAASVAVIAREVMAAAQLCASNEGSLYGGILHLSWDGARDFPANPAASVIASISPLGLALMDLHLKQWPFDEAVAMQVTEAAPRLSRLALIDCSICSSAWVVLEALTALKVLRLADPVPCFQSSFLDALVSFAVSWQGKDLRVEVLGPKCEVHACNLNIQALRCGRGMTSTLSLAVWT